MITLKGIGLLSSSRLLFYSGEGGVSIRMLSEKETKEIGDIKT